VLNLGYVIFQIVISFSIHSLSLLSDALHNFADVIALALSLLAFKLASIKKHHLEHVNIHHATLEFDAIENSTQEEC
jgi:Co/Zn/Cd efflux system component